MAISGERIFGLWVGSFKRSIIEAGIPSRIKIISRKCALFMPFMLTKNGEQCKPAFVSSIRPLGEAAPSLRSKHKYSSCERNMTVPLIR